MDELFRFPQPYSLRVRPAHQDPAGLVDKGWVDEAYCTKRPDSHTATAIKGLEPKFFGLTTAMPYQNRITDFKGYLEFIAPKEANENPQEMAETFALDEDENPYMLPKEDDASMPRLTKYYAGKFIFGNKNEIQLDCFLGKMLEKCKIRRTIIRNLIMEQ